MPPRLLGLPPSPGWLGCGLAVWNGGVVVCRMLELNLLPPLEGTVVELGAGCGLPGMYLAALRRRADREQRRRAVESDDAVAGACGGGRQ